MITKNTLDSQTPLPRFNNSEYSFRYSHNRLRRNHLPGFAAKVNPAFILALTQVKSGLYYHTTNASKARQIFHDNTLKYSRDRYGHFGELFLSTKPERYYSQQGNCFVLAFKKSVIEGLSPYNIEDMSSHFWLSFMKKDIHNISNSIEFIITSNDLPLNLPPSFRGIPIFSLEKCLNRVNSQLPTKNNQIPATWKRKVCHTSYDYDNVEGSFE